MPDLRYYRANKYMNSNLVNFEFKYFGEAIENMPLKCTCVTKPIIYGHKVLNGLFCVVGSCDSSYGSVFYIYIIYINIYFKTEIVWDVIHLRLKDFL